MNIRFDDAPLRDLFSRFSALKKQFGAALSGTISCRLSMLSAAPCLADVPAAPPIGLMAHRNGLYSVTLGRGHRLRFRGLGGAGAEPTEVRAIVILGLAGPDGSPIGTGGTP